jgi:hypothetical protein
MYCCVSLTVAAFLQATYPNPLHPSNQTGKRDPALQWSVLPEDGPVDRPRYEYTGRSFSSSVADDDDDGDYATVPTTYNFKSNTAV